MPTYVYVTVNDDGSDGSPFEAVQRMSDPPLTRHPESGKPVRRVPVAPNIGGGWSDASTKAKLSDSNLDRLGFSKYVNAGDGRFEKSAGAGPDRLSAD
ncbi:MAG TPA: hypothetical protein PKC43_13230 [Phycisphaerales bacterium]|nr:hypothetical protein [Phycisphaerales bacterium]HMP38395.1 hypothetical protein [Phycisphaerales bacterium]